MNENSSKVVIKKYANRRLYHTGNSAYVTLEDLAEMVKRGEEFAVVDAKTGEDITRSVLTQIIFEQENKDGQFLLPISVLRQLIGFYGDSLQGLLPSYLELSFERFAKEQDRFRDQMGKAFSIPGFGELDKQVKQNMEIFEQAFKMFMPFGAGGSDTSQQPGTEASSAGSDEKANSVEGNSSDIRALKQQLDSLQSQIDKLNSK